VQQVLADEDLALGSPGHRPDPLAHAQLAHHLAGQLGGPLQVVAGARRERSQDEPLGAPPTHHHGQGRLEVLEPVGVPLLEGQLLGGT
jgi:hypothetical protein